MDFVLQRAGAELSGNDAELRRAAAAARDRWPLAEAELHAARHSRAAAANENPLSARCAFNALQVARRLGASTPWTLLRVEDPLTQREREVAAAVAAGGSNREVADGTGVSVRTVENQLQSVYRKLGISGRKDLNELFL
ncbi:MAG: response regulator transcription factor [Acidimicrobiales bacterium]|nr:response regulator transcription factor [Acidimicrobiales bacterium]